MKIKAWLIAAMLCIGGLVGVSALMSEVAYAECTCPAGSLHPGESCTSLAECNIPKEGEAPGTDKPLMERVVDIINLVVGVVSIIAVVVIVIGGILFVTSTGETAKTTRARNTIIYGVVGLVVSLLAFALVNFVSRAVFNSGGGTSQSSSDDSGD